MSLRGLRLKFIAIMIDINTLDTIMLTMGMPFLFFIVKNAGNNLSRAAAIGICPWINIHPSSAPNVAITAPPATRYLAVSPHIAAAASANGACDVFRTSGGSIPMTAMVPST